MSLTQTHNDLEAKVEAALANMKFVDNEKAKCDICIHVFGMTKEQAESALVDGRTVTGSWGFMCRGHFGGYSENVESKLNTRLRSAD